MSEALPPGVSSARRAAAWSVHLLTAGGAVAGLLALLAIGRSRFEVALGWMGLALLVDSVDGELARRVDVSRVLPHVDGALLDNLVDYLTYVVVPACLIERADLLPDGWDVAAGALICLCAAFQFARRDAKTDDLMFTGFPSCWNLVAFYLLLLGWNRWCALLVVVALCVLSIVPLRWVYPGRTRRGRSLTRVLTLAWYAVLAWLLVRYPHHEAWLVQASLLYVVYYAALSIALDVGRGRVRG